jgi:short subunit dehydrogenase-like uncharacterized protein
MTASPKPFDLVVHGATGFTGRLVVEYLLQRAPQGGPLRWAMGGRNADKLAAVRDELGAPASTPLVVTDTRDPASLAALMASTRLVLSTVGPYQLYGNELVAACAAHGVDYTDLCGEPAWMRRMIDAHETAARASGARIVFSCGFDSIPFDLGVLTLQTEFAARHGHPASRVRGRVRRMKGTFSGGTAASLKATLAAAAGDPAVLALLRDPFSLTPGFEGPRQPSGTKPLFDDALGQWCAPFIMAAINTRNVHRSHRLLGHPWGPGFVYDEMVLTGPGEAGERMAHALAADTSLAADDGPKPGEGPSRQEREAGFYDLLFVGHDAEGRSTKLGVKGQRDPGYGSTSRLIAEASLCLQDEARGTPGGIWTPAAALGLALIPRLEQHAQLRFAVED